MANEEAPNRAPHTTPNLLFTSNTRAIESTFSGVASAQSQKKYILANISIVKHLKAALGSPSTKKRDSASIEDSGAVMSSDLDSEGIAPHPFHSSIWCPLDDVQAEFYRDYVLLHTLFWEKPLRLEARPTKMSNWRLPPTPNKSGEPEEHGGEVDDISILRIPPAMFPAIRGELMLREVYQTLFEKLKERSGIAPRSGMTITGQPGIGKSLFLIYGLACRLSQGKPTVFYDSCDKKILLYNAHGVFTRSQTYINVSEHELPLGTWALINSTPPASVPSFLISKNSPFYIVLATSPNHAQDETWMFDRLMPTYYMTLWSWKEIRAGNCTESS
ncbi:hypothetical protein BS47DRAFT_1201700 [Hydnum rufescens UP504]|uniref:Uncharacterized protein n=1 Tax=Hydnum rufescens UP504 TaxID=1448309 RepID=A0A9P6DQH5_9AGAM|nr:hypothetical protein BS47DRAFT_1201700 [Hydnum rufescens UP504]